MKLLVLGGTAWLGGEVARQAVAAGHEVTCLARGSSGDFPDGVRAVVADRSSPGAYDGLPAFDAVIEVSWDPAQVTGAVAAVRAEHWVYVSSISVYADPDDVSRGTAGALLDPLEAGEPATDAAYGNAKVACEQLIATTGSHCLARAGLIAGPGDPTDRFTYWPVRIAEARDERRRVLCPPLSIPVQVVDVRDLAAWLLHCAEERVSGTFDAVGERTDLAAVVEAATLATGADPDLDVLDSATLIERGIRPWSGPGSLPLWAGRDDTAFLRRDPGPAIAAGLRLRPIADTVRAVLP